MSNRTCMNQNMSAGTRSMRGGYGYPGTAPMRPSRNDCGCGNSGMTPQNIAQPAQNNCGCGSSGMAPQNTARQVQNDCGCGSSGMTPQNTAQPAQNSCGCGNTGMTPQNTARQVQNDCGCGSSGMTPQNTARQVQNDCGCGSSGMTPQNTAQPAQNSCGCGSIPTGDRICLRNYIDEMSFAAYEAALYLDTHPDCQNAMQYFQEHNERRNFALKEYGRLYGPMTLMQAGENCDACWQWINQPWPWEGGNC